MDAERGKAEEGGATEPSKATKVTKPKAAKVTKPAGGRVPKKEVVGMIDQPADEGVPVEEPAHDDEEADLQLALELKLQGTGKEKVVEEQVVHDLLTLQTPKKNKSDKEASNINARNQEEGHTGPNPGVQDKGQAGPNPGVQDKGQARPNLGIAAESQLQSSHVVHTVPNLEYMDLGTSDASTHQKPEKMDEVFTTTTYPNVQKNLKVLTEDQVILEEHASSTGTLSSLQNLEKDQKNLKVPTEDQVILEEHASSTGTLSSL
ncbi:hypothetical protein Tco_1331311, partial [Tanacetum coccineum]